MAILLIAFFFFIIPSAFDPGMSNNPSSSMNYCSGLIYFHAESHTLSSNTLNITLVNGRNNITIEGIFINNIRASEMRINNTVILPGNKFYISADFPGLDLGSNINYNLKINFIEAGQSVGNQENAICSG